MNDNDEQIAASAPKLQEWQERRKLPDGHPLSPVVFIRPLQLNDAETSWQWRNDPDIWRLTGSKPDRYITPDLEKKWLTEALSRESEKRFAICLKENGRYIGNVFYKGITSQEAEAHIFLGEPTCWGKGIATDAALLLHEYGFGPMGLERIYSTVNSSNIAILRLGYSLGFVKVAEEYDEKFSAEVTRLVLTRRTYQAYTGCNGQHGAR